MSLVYLQHPWLAQSEPAGASSTWLWRQSKARNKSKNPSFLAGCSMASQGNSQQSAKSGSPLTPHFIPLLVEHPCGCSLDLLLSAAVKTRNEHFGVKPGELRPLSIPAKSQDESASKDNRRQDLAQDGSSAKFKAQGLCRTGNEMSEGSGAEGKHFPGKSHSEIVLPIKSRLQSVTIMHPNDRGRGGF